MKNLSLLFVLALFITIQTSCKKDEEQSGEDCAGLLETGEKMVVDGETFNLSIAQLLISSSLNATVYQFQVAGIANDCNTSKVLSFVIDIAENEELNGTYPITNFFDAGLGDFYGVTITDQTFSPVSQNLTEISSGTIQITKNGEKDFTVDIQGVLITGGAVEVQFSKAF